MNINPIRTPYYQRPLPHNLLKNNRDSAKRIQHMVTFLLNLPQSISSRFSRKIFFIGLSILLFSTLLWFYREEISQIFNIISERETLVAFLKPYGNLGVLILYIFLFLQVFIATIPGQAIIISGGYLYGFWIGLLISYSSTVVASHLCYELARRYGRPLVKKLAPANVVDKWTVRAERQGIPFFIFSFTTPIFPADVMNFVAGLSGLSPRKFMVANVIGRLPSAIVFTLIGSHGLGLPINLMIAVAVIFTFIALGVWRMVGPKLEQKYLENES